MPDQRWRQIELLFVQAAECAPADRQAFLDHACQGDAELRSELESLLAYDAPDHPLVEFPTRLSSDAMEDHGVDREMAGRRIGPYRLTSLIGHGGMGAVYLGVRDDDQYHKQVAIKVMKRGMDTDFMLSRFRQERQILAKLEHPFIARMMDGGATEDGLPYFVMEYVDGVPITRFCIESELSVPEKLRLFRLVCEAVQHAHQNLVVHRDIKPSNILTTQEGVPKLLDFGIAKVLRRDSRGSVSLTQVEHRMLTPDYASPEQVKGLPISTASDTYSLGIVLFELLTGQRPHKFASGSLADMEIAICEHDPEKPSIVVARDQNIPAAVRKQLQSQLAGDLDNIVLAALRKEPQRRYASAAEFSEDLRRHMENLPIIAQVDKWSYRAGKFVRRNRIAVGAAALVALSLIAGIVATTYQARRAERRFQLVRQLANSLSFDLYDRVAKLPGSIPARLAMVQTVAQYLDTLAQDSGDDQLDVEIANSYKRVATLEGYPFSPNLGETVIALDHFQKAIELYKRVADRDPFNAGAIRGLVATHMQVASVEVVLGHPASSEAHLQMASEIAGRASSGTAARLPDETMASLHMDIGIFASDHGDIEAEVSNMRRAVEIGRHWAEAEPSLRSLTTLSNSYSQMGKALFHAGDLAGARESFLLSFQVAERSMTMPGADETARMNVVGVHHLYGDMLGATDEPNLGEFDAALSQYRAAANVGETLSARDPRDVNPRRNLAGSYRRIGLISLESNPAHALEFYSKAVQISTAINVLEPRNIHYRSALADGLLGQGQAYHRLGRHPEALETLKHALELQKSIEAAAPDQLFLMRSTTRAYMAIGNVFLALGDAPRALENLQAGLASAQKLLEHYPLSVSLALDRADLFEALGAYYVILAQKLGLSNLEPADSKAEARRWYQKSLASWQDWIDRKVAASYAERRVSRAKALLASVH